jgi:hypothetical protein
MQGCGSGAAAGEGARLGPRSREERACAGQLPALTLSVSTPPSLPLSSRPWPSSPACTRAAAPTPLPTQVGAGLLRHFGGRAAALVGAARGSVAALVELIASHFPGFRDHCVYKGRQARRGPRRARRCASRGARACIPTHPLASMEACLHRGSGSGTRPSVTPCPPALPPPTPSPRAPRQVFFYKRAQIFAADVFGAFEGRGLGAFVDAGGLTCFADYRVPVVLRELGVIAYTPDLASKVGGGWAAAAKGAAARASAPWSAGSLVGRAPVADPQREAPPRLACVSGRGNAAAQS